MPRSAPGSGRKFLMSLFLARRTEELVSNISVTGLAFPLWQLLLEVCVRVAKQAQPCRLEGFSRPLCHRADRSSTFPGMMPALAAATDLVGLWEARLASLIAIASAMSLPATGSALSPHWWGHQASCLSIV